MDERIPPAVYFQYSPSGVHSSPSPHHSMRSPAASDRERSASFSLVMYLAGLLAERQKLGPFPQVLPFFCRLLNQEIHMAFLVSSYVLGGLLVYYHYFLIITNGYFSIQENECFHRTGILQASAPGWNGTAGVNTSPIIKKVIRLDIPVDKLTTILTHAEIF
ncbi:hypothetical protein C4D60_Mb01t09940 [Musa balbisiana]|uniref:STAR protein homodimerisation region domain-containing protein n=1 Tax=Musa balbisiana TaxID=52838 RepID=A0A4S8JNJ7_MUSBA|nr:hypothetical protein C4D60_Mb01t09940 [Musa balbisiana]